MEYFHSDGGNNKPFFIYRFKVKKKSLNRMFDWCEDYPEKGPFSRWHVIYNSEPKNDGVDREEIPLIQFELRDAYLAFMYAFAGEILSDETWEEFR